MNMARAKRRWVSQDIGSFHIISRVAGGELLFNEGDKECFLRLLERFAVGFFVEIHAFCIMSNHFHILATGLEKEARSASKEELFRRYRLIFGQDADPPVGRYDTSGRVIPDADKGVERLRRRLGSISRFVQELKQTFSRFYNKKYDRVGYLWGDRFKGVIVSKGEAQLACSAYIDLNPVRAGIVKKPEDYRWSSLGLRMRTPARARMLLRPLSILPGFADGAECDEGVEGMENTVEPMLTPIILSEKSFDHIFSYREFVYKSGGVERSGSAHISPELVNDVLKYHGDFGVGDRFRYRIKNFSEGVALGNYALIAHLQKSWNRRYIRPRSFMGRKSGCNWSFTTRVLRL
jgi:REP element-mobilizing transposase RayT